MIELRLKRSVSAPPLYTQICEQLSWQILNGRLKNGAVLPPTRELARQLGVSRGIVVRAYEYLCSTGLCLAQVGRGTRVSYRTHPTSPENVDSAKMPLASRMPEPPIPGSLSLLPSHASTRHLPVSDFRQAFNQVMRYPDRLNQFEESAGNMELRRLLCETILPSRGITASPSEVLIVPGSQYGSVLLAMAMGKERSAFHFGDPGYMEFARNFSRFGYQLYPHPMDCDGINLTGYRGTDQDIIYLMPEHHFPQCITLSEARRQHIISLACEHNVLILEDDYDSEFYFDRAPQPALRASKAANQVIYMGTFSKAIFNSVRLGYLVANEHLVAQMAALHWSLSRGTSGLLQQWVCELIKKGTYERHIRRMRTVYRHKRDTLITLIEKYLPDAQFTVPSGGLQLYLRFPDTTMVARITDWLNNHNIQTASFRHYCYQPNATDDFLILGFANSDINEVENVLHRLWLALEK